MDGKSFTLRADPERAELLDRLKEHHGSATLSAAIWATLADYLPALERAAEARRDLVAERQRADGLAETLDRLVATLDAEAAAAEARRAALDEARNRLS